MNLPEFMHLHGNSEYRHKEELESGISDGSIKFERSLEGKQKGESYLQIYKTRRDGLAKSESDTNHVKSLLKDVEALCEGFKKYTNESIDHWSFDGPRFLGYTVFVAHDSEEIIGCVKGADDRQVNDENYKELWGRERKKLG